jgi:hypothetical protein
MKLVINFDTKENVVMDNMKRFFPWVVIFSMLLVILACSLFTGTKAPVETSEPTITFFPTDTPSQSLEIATIVPTPTPTVKNELTIDVNPIPQGELGVANVHAFQDEFDSWVVVGLLVNKSDRAMDAIEIEIKALDLNGIPLYNELAYSALYSLSPGDTSPFSTWVWEDLPGVQEFTATIVGFSTSNVEQVDLEVRGTQMNLGNGDVHITGELVNTNDSPVQIGNIAAATFDSDGRLITAGSEVVAISYLDPGESGPFYITMDKPVDDSIAISDFSIYTNAEVTIEKDKYEISFLEIRDYYDTDGDYHLVGELQNNSDVNLSISLLASIFDAAGNVLDADDVDLPVYSVAGGERMFFDFDGWYALNSVEGLAALSDSYVIQADTNWTWKTETTYVDLDVNDGGFEYDPFWGFTFTGTVVNNTGVSANSGEVIVVLRDDESGSLLAMGYTSLWDEIPTGSTMNYEVFVEIEPDFNLEGFDFSVIAKGELP